MMNASLIDLDGFRLGRLDARRNALESALRRVQRAGKSIDKDADALRQQLAVETALFCLGQGAGNDRLNFLQDSLSGVLEAGAQAISAISVLEEWLTEVQVETEKVQRRRSYHKTKKGNDNE